VSRDREFALGVAGGGLATPKVSDDDNPADDWSELVRYFEVFQRAETKARRAASA
jgi:hypothetical protein